MRVRISPRARIGPAELLGDRWTIHIVRDLLTRRRRQLTMCGVVEHTDDSTYQLTDAAVGVGQCRTR